MHLLIGIMFLNHFNAPAKCRKAFPSNEGCCVNNRQANVSCMFSRNYQLPIYAHYYHPFSIDVFKRPDFSVYPHILMYMKPIATRNPCIY